MHEDRLAKLPIEGNGRVAGFGAAVEAIVAGGSEVRDRRTTGTGEDDLLAIEVPGRDRFEDGVVAAARGGAIPTRPGGQRQEKLARLACRGDGPSAEKVGASEATGSTGNP